MPGFLLDTMTVRFLTDPSHRHHQRAIAAFKAVPRLSPLYMSVITVGEIAAGVRRHTRLHPGVDGAKLLRERIPEYPQILSISESAAMIYGQLRAELIFRFKDGKKSGKVRAESLKDPVSGKELGIDENDLWITSQAIDRNLVIVTNDKMFNIRSVIATVFPNARFEDWAAEL